MAHAWMIAPAAALMSAAAAPAGAEPVLTWTGGVAGGGWDTISRGVAKLIHDETVVRLVPEDGALNPVRVNKGQADIGLGLPPRLRAETIPHPGHPMPHLRALAGNMSVNALHLHREKGWLAHP
jgi:hypothetical protein